MNIEQHTRHRHTAHYNIIHGTMLYSTRLVLSNADSAYSSSNNNSRMPKVPITTRWIKIHPLESSSLLPLLFWRTTDRRQSSSAFQPSSGHSFSLGFLHVPFPATNHITTTATQTYTHPRVFLDHHAPDYKPLLPPCSQQTLFFGHNTFHIVPILARKTL